MDDQTKAFNAAGFLMSSARVTNGRLKVQFLKNTYRGTKNAVEVRLRDWDISTMLDSDEVKHDVQTLLKICEFWMKYEKRNQSFYNGLRDLLAADTGDFQRVKNFTSDLLDDEEVISKFVSKIHMGCNYIQTKWKLANEVFKSFYAFENKCKNLKYIQRQLDKKILSEREAAEKAKESLEDEEEFLTKATEFYEMRAKEETEASIQLVLKTEVKARKPDLNWDELSLAVVEVDFAGVMIFDEGATDIAEIKPISDLISKSQIMIKNILDLEAKTTGQEKEWTRKKKLFYDDLKDILEEIEDEPPDEITELAVINDLIERIKEIDSTYKEMRRSNDDFPAVCNIGGEEIELKTKIQKTKVDLLTAKENLTTKKSEEKDFKKTKDLELSKSLGKIELAKLKGAKDFLLWSHSIQQFLRTVEGLDETRVAMTVLNSIENKALKRQLEGERDLGVIIETVRIRFEHNDDIIGATVNHLTKLKDPETIAQACYNCQEISRSLLQLSRVDILDQISKDMLLNLERKSFASEHRNTYLMEKMKHLDMKDDKKETKDKTKYGERFNLVGGIKKKVSKTSIKIEVEFFNQYINEYISTTRYMLAQDRAADKRPKKSPQAKKKYHKDLEEKPGATSRIFNTKGSPRQAPMKRCPLGCSHSIQYGSVEFCDAFLKKQVPDRKKLVKAKHLCTQCLKVKTTHEGRKCRAPLCKNCKSSHHWLLCDSINDQVQIFRTKDNASDDEDDDDDKSDEDDVDELHIRYLMTQEQQEGDTMEDEKLGSGSNSESEADTIDAEQENTQEENDDEEIVVINQLRTIKKPKQKKDIVDKWWNSVIADTKGRQCETKENEQDSDDEKVVSGATNVRLLLSEPAKDEDGDPVEVVRVDKLSTQEVDGNGAIERALCEDLSAIKHKWPDNQTRGEIQELYRCPDTFDISDVDNCLYITRDCLNPEIYDTILKLCALMFAKYGGTRGW